MIRRNRNTHLAARLFGFAAVAFCLSAAPAAAAPSFGVDLDYEASELQVVTVNATAGQFRLTFANGAISSTTGDLAYDAEASVVADALNNLESIKAGGGSVTVKREEPVIDANSRGYFVTFKGGPLAHTNVAEMTAEDGATPLSGGVSTGASVSTFGPAEISRGDERVDYTVKVENTAAGEGGPAQVGDKLFCNGIPPAKLWHRVPTTNYSFSFQWVRNGANLESAEDLAHGSQTNTYTVQAADEEKALQCVIKGTNGTGSGSFVSTTQPATEVAPLPVPLVEAPKPNVPNLGDRRPAISGSAKTAGEELTCTAPTAGWSVSNGISPISWTFKWLRNGVAASAGVVTETTATTSKFQIAASELATKAAFQCMATATNAGPYVTIVESRDLDTEAPAPVFVEETSDGRPFSFAEAVVEKGASGTSGTVTLELELPGGEETFAFKTEGLGWACTKVPASGSEHAKAICTRSDVLAEEKSYPDLKVITVLGGDAPDTAVAKATVSGGGAAAPASDEEAFAFGPPIPFGLTAFEAAVFDREGNNYTQAGGHPFSAVGNFVFAKKRQLTGENSSESARYVPIEHVRQVITDLPRGFVGNALAVPKLCPSVQDVKAKTCPPESQIGELKLLFSGFSGVVGGGFAMYAIKPEFGTPAQIAFEGGGGLFTLSARLRPAEGYAISLELAPGPVVDLLKAKATLCNYGVNLSGNELASCKEAGEPGANPKPLFGNPTRCGSPPPIARARLDSWEHPGADGPDSLPDFSDPDWKSYEDANPEVTGCDKVSFEPAMKLEPTSHQADSPTGLDVNLTMQTNGLEGKDDEGNPDPEATSQANLKRAKVTFPRGMAINAGAGQGLGSCSAQQVKLETNKPIECPESSKIGTVEIETPLIEETLKGATYLAKQGEVGGALSGLYLVFDSKKDGILIKIPARIDPDPKTGQLTVTVDESPEAPFSAVKMHFPGGPRATLLTPPKCGKYQIKAELSPWSAADPDNPTAAETVTQVTPFEVTQGPNGGPCPSGALDPKLSSGSEDPTAGKTSPFVFRLHREDGSDRFSSLSLKMPLGLTAYLKGIPYCPDAVLGSISSALETGQAEIDHPSCPAASRLGSAAVGAGGGTSLLYVDTGKVYLAGPYKGAPASLAVVSPAVAGPLDLGNVVIRNPVYIDPESTQITIKSDPIPTILHGILPDIRDIRVRVDRPHFTLNPTSCEEKSVKVDVKGENGGSASAANRFQAKDCEKLGFKPKITTTLFGPTKRAGHPSLRGVLTPRPGDANLKSATVTIPRSEFLDQAHIRTICTRVQFAANACPKGSIYGHATATTPLLDYALSGPVYLRSSNNKLPDLVIAVKGPDYQPIEAAVVGRIDSINGQIRASFEANPDVPLSKVVIHMQGGKKGLLVNSRDICARPYRASVELEAHNGASANSRPVLRNSKCQKGRKGKRHKRPRG